MKSYIKKYSNFVIKKPVLILFFVFAFAITGSIGISDFKLDASSDALVLEGDQALKTYRENEEEFGDSSFLIVTFEPKNELFSPSSLETLKNLERDISEIDGVDSVLSLMDAPIFFQPKVGLTEVADNLKELDSEGIDLADAKNEIINNPIYQDLIISKDGSITAMQIVLKGNNEYNGLIKERYEVLDALNSKEPITYNNKIILQDRLVEINKRVSELNDTESEFNSNLVANIRLILDKYRDKATLYLGGPTMITSDMMDYIRSDLVIFGTAVALIFALMLYIFFGNLWFVIFPISNAFL